MSNVCNPRQRKTAKRRFRYQLRGQLQGVGFRPFVYRLANSMGLTGWVLNDGRGVTLEVQGKGKLLKTFENRLKQEQPPLARLESIEHQVFPVQEMETTFEIRASAQAGRPNADVTVDSAVCPECLAELFNAADRRFQHAFINCTNCGPRFSILRDVPYDRPNTTMAAFEMCPRCASEYREPRDRRFHAQPICCPDCGPELSLESVDGSKVPGNAAAETARLLAAGKIVAVKGIGGFHLAVRADDAKVVRRLRTLKHRDSKPFALMVPNASAAQRLVRLSPEAHSELISVAAPIVLAPRTEIARREIAEDVAPGTHLLGVMLPYTAVHHLLFRALGEVCRGSPPALVMTSGNVCDEPLAIENDDARNRLATLCDAFLMHNRPIQRCLDDSVVLDRGTGDAVLPIRRSRGYVPTSWQIPEQFTRHETGICLGGELKSTVAVVRQRDVIVSQHFGDLSHPLAFEHFRRCVDDLVRLFNVQIDFVAHDLHPNYISTQFAQRLASEHGARLIPVQHHVAHAHAVLAENGIHSPALAIVCDGTGYGFDRLAWGGELLWIEGMSAQRIGSLRPIRLPGGDAAAKDPRRSALALLHAAFGETIDRLPVARRLCPDPVELAILAYMIRHGVNSPWTTSASRLFDGVAALLGICTQNGHEAEAAMALEAAAWEANEVGAKEASPSFAIGGVDGVPRLDLTPMIRKLVESAAQAGNVPMLAAEFHRELAAGLIAMVCESGFSKLPVAIGGGTFCNQFLTRELLKQAAVHQIEILAPKKYPPTDAGLSFGQAVYVLQHFAAEGRK